MISYLNDGECYFKEYKYNVFISEKYFDIDIIWFLIFC